MKYIVYNYYTGYDGNKPLGWYQGKISEILNTEKGVSKSNGTRTV